MIALDGADSRLLRRLCDGGQLPSISALVKRGRFCFLRNAEETSDDSAWASFCYGVPLAQHHRFHFRETTSAGKNRMAVRCEDGGAAFWIKLSGRGQRVAVIDVPKCPTPVDLNGIHLADWLVHGRYHPEPVSFPPDLAASTVARFGAAPESRCGYYQDSIDLAEGACFADHLKQTIGRKLECGMHHLSRQAWDLFIIGFKEAHCAGHSLWHLHQGARGVPGAAAYDPVVDVYQALDEAVGKLVKSAGKQASVVVFSTFDMVENGSLWHLREELCGSLDRQLRRGLMSPAQRIADALTAPFRKPPAPLCRICPANDNQLAFHVSAHAGSNKQVLCEQLETLLRELKADTTGLPAFTLVESKTWVGAKQADKLLPDVVAHCTLGQFPQAIRSAQLGRITADVPSMRTGNHVAGGAMILAGHRVLEAGTEVTGLHQLAVLADAVLMHRKSRTLTELVS